MEDVVLCVFYLWLAGVGVAAVSRLKMRNDRG